MSRLLLALALAHSYPIPPTGELASPGSHLQARRALRSHHVYHHHGTGDDDNPIVNLIIGLILIVAAPVLLVTAEFEAARFAKLLKQARWMTCADAPSDRPRKRFNAHIVHTQGAMSVGPSWSDADTGVSWGAPKSGGVDERVSIGPLRIKRHVDVFAWKEKETKRDNTTTYTYHQEWVDAPAPDSNAFKHAGYHNPPLTVNILTNTFERDDVSLGAYALSQEALHRADWWEDHAIPQTTALGGKLKSKKSCRVMDGVIYISSGGPPVGVGEPAIGDMRIRYATVPCPQGACTAVGLQEEGEVLGKTPTLRPATRADVYKCAGVAAPAGEAAITSDDVTNFGPDLSSGGATPSNVCCVCGLITLFVSKLIVFLLPHVIGNDVSRSQPLWALAPCGS